MSPTIVAPSHLPVRFAAVVTRPGGSGAGQLASGVLITVTPDSARGRSLIPQAARPDSTRMRFAPGDSRFCEHPIVAEGLS